MITVKSLSQCGGLLVMLLAAPVLHAFGGASVFQSFSLKIPKFALVNIEQSTPRFHFSKGSSHSAAVRTRISVTSNSQYAQLRVAAESLPKGISLRISSADGLCSAMASSIEPNRFSCQVGIKSLWDGELILTAQRTADLTDGDYAIRLRYSLEN